MNIAPLNQLYGGMPSSGGYRSIKEYEVGVARVAEAAHCVLGSLVRMQPGLSMHGELVHIDEEIDIIEFVFQEYSKALYIRQLHDVEQYLPKYQERAKRDIEDMFIDLKINSPKLSKLAQEKLKLLNQNKQQFSMFKFDLAEAAYKFLALLAEKLLENVQEWEQTHQLSAKNSIFLDKELKSLIAKMRTVYFLGEDPKTQYHHER